MRNMISKFGLMFVAMLSIASAAFLTAADAQTLPYQNPTYIPNSVLAPVTLSAPGAVAFTNSGGGVMSLRVSGTCTSLAATVQASNDGTNYTVINIYPVASYGAAASPASAVAAAGFWKANVSGFTSVKVNVTALTASCTFALVGAPLDFTNQF